MERELLQELVKWKNSKYRKPLILKGARQVGKTWILKEFGARHYKNVAYFSFDENPEYKEFFQSTKNVDRIIENLRIASMQKIDETDTLIIFDEVQECPEALNTLKYFCENRPEYHVACAGSLLGIALAKPSSFPVGKVDFLEVYPMTFREFLLANGDQNLAFYLDSIEKIETIPDAFFNPLVEKIKTYFIVGGMPEAVKIWTREKDMGMLQKVLFDILSAYESDFAKYPDLKEYPKITLVWKSIPSQLSRENKKFLYRVVKDGARAREYEDAIEWLCNANLTYKVFRSQTPGLPLSAYDDISSFKLYLGDVGLLRRLSLLSPTAFAEGNRLFTEFKGALTENYVLQSLKKNFEGAPRYWSEISPQHEVDFLVQHENDVLPIEVKSDVNIESKRLKRYREKYKDKTKLSIRISLRNLKFDDGILNVPIFMTDYIEKLILMCK